MRNPTIPDRLCRTQPYDGIEPGDTMQLGVPMSKGLERYLEAAFRGWTLEERIAQLEQLDERCALAWHVSREGRDVDAVKRRLGVQKTVAYALLATARRFLLWGIDARELSDEERWHVLRVCDPFAFQVLSATALGWRQSGIAAHFTAQLCSRDPRAGERCAGEACGHPIVSVDQVKRAAARGRRIVDRRNNTAARFYLRAITGGSIREDAA